MELPELWLFQCADCARDPGELTEPKAHFILRVHTHAPDADCLPRRAALTYLR